MSWLQCDVEMYSSRSSSVINEKVSARSVFEAAWIALCGWAGGWSYDPDASVVVRQDGKEWRVSQQRIRNWRPLVQAEQARRFLVEAKKAEVSAGGGAAAASGVALPRDV